jgi:Ni/Fe-hydrogenase 1 B-type cytochrome subunit
MSERAFYREEHPPVFIVTHWLILLGVGFLILSGLYIHYPFIPGLMGVATSTHTFWAFVLVIAIILRVVLAFFVKDANMMSSREVDTDIKNWLPQKANRHQLWPTIKYYLFVKREHPISAKYGVLQKFAYLLSVPVVFAAAYTGFALWGPTHSWSFFAAGTAWVGGLMYMRIIHFFIMWAILVFVALHTYLASIYGTPPLKLMLLGQETIPDGQ